jgi:ankyrin repeat protein
MTSPHPRALPPQPHLDHLRRQARELLRAWHAGDAAALARAAPYRLPAPPRLAGAQLVIAREHGFGSWPQLVLAVEQQRERGLSEAEFLERLLTLAIGRGYAAPNPMRALALAGTRSLQSPPLALVVALLLGDLPAVQRAGVDVHARLAPWDAPPLVYAAFSSLARLPSHQAQLVQTVQWLLAQGADPNAGLHEPAFPEHPLPVLFGAVARASCLATTEALLQAGANPNDNESLYHATEQTDRRLLAALVQAGARWAGTNALMRQLDHDDLDGLRQALDLGADPNEARHDDVPPLHHALQRGRGLPFVQLLVARGADPLARDPQGHTAALYAAHSGDRDTLRWLVAQGVPAPAEPAQQFLAACAAGDELAARAHLAQHPDAVAQLGPAGWRLLPDQAQRGRLDAVRLMLSLGWPVATRGDWDASALNQAAFRGDAAMVQLLLAHGARWHEPNGFGGDALGSCLHAACHQPDPGGDYAAVLGLLLDDGAPPPTDLDDLPDALQDLLLARA